MCDICQEERAVLFCTEDRAVICRQCDLMIHTANEFTAKHHRYILSNVATGLKALPPPGEGYDDDLSDPSSEDVSAATRLDKGKQEQSSREPQRPSAMPHQTRARTAAVSGSAIGAGSRANSDNLINDGAGPSAMQSLGSGLTGASLLGGSGQGGLPPPSAGMPSSSSYYQPQADTAAAQASASTLGAASGEQGLNLWWQPSNQGVTQAGEVLGMSGLDGYTAKDIDVAYMADPQMFDDFEADLSSLLEVPDLDFPDSLDLPSGSFRDSSSQQWAVPTADPQALPGAAGSMGQLISPHPVTTGSTKSSSKLPHSDQTVPDMPSLKRQRV